MDAVKLFIEKLVYPGMERLKGNRVRYKTAELLDLQSASVSCVSEYREKKLRGLLRHCVKNVPAYRDYEKLAGDIERDPMSALKGFPILNKDAFRRESASYLSGGTDKGSLIANHTGGSSGNPVSFFMDRETVEYYEAARWRGLSWRGITPGSRSVMIWGNPAELSASESIKYRLKERLLKNRIIIPAHGLSAASLDNQLDRIIRFCPEYFYGYASALYAFAQMLRESGRRLPFTPKAVVSTSEMLHGYQREAIEAAFGCFVANEYGARDAGILAYECPQGGMHLTNENLILEILHPVTLEPVKPGQSGLAVVTDLNNYSMPRLRYVLGDMVSLSENERCSCGRTMPLLKSVDGRQTDMFLSKDGKLIHGSAFNSLAVSCPAVKQFRIVQKSVEHTLLTLVKENDSEPSELAGFISMIEKMLPGSFVEVVFAQEIPPLSSGKLAYAIREFELQSFAGGKE